jgi:hypothetical protein
VTTVFTIGNHIPRAVEMNEKLIGVYATEDDANGAIERFKGQPGFWDYLEGFEIDPYEIGKDHWEEGYSTA